MITNTDSAHFVMCNKCGKFLGPFYSWDEIQNTLRRSHWKMICKNHEWKELCPDCIKEATHD